MPTAVKRWSLITRVKRSDGASSLDVVKGAGIDPEEFFRVFR
jgi:hypothetical protein